MEINGLIPLVKNVDELFAMLEERGYTVKRGKHISVKAPGQQRAVRLEKLGDIYSLDSLDIRIRYVSEDNANRDEPSELQVAYNAVIGEVTQLAQSGQKVQRKRNSDLPYSAQNDMDVYKLPAQLTIINRDHLRSIGEVTGKIDTLQKQYENARLEMNRLTAQLEKLDSLAEQAEHYFTIMEKDKDLSEPEKLMISMECETLERNNIHSREDYMKLDMLRKNVCNQVGVLKKQFTQAKHLYDVYSDIAATYRTITEGDYISRLMKEKQQEEQQKRPLQKRAADNGGSMRRNERDTTIATEGGNITPSIALTAEQESAFVKAMKIGYYKEFYRQGLITAEQLEVLIVMQDKSEHKKAA